jgi:ABC-type phosphate/phosphonate transport system substrate-binding protein
MTDLNLAVCPHDTVRNSEGWFRLVQYLSQKLAADVHFSLSLDFADFHERFSASDLVYANPSDAIKLIDGHGYTPLVRPADTYDEALLVAGPDGPPPALTALAGAPLATITTMLPTKIGLRLLNEENVAPGNLVNCDSWLGVVRSVWGGDTPYGIIYRDAYDELSEQGKAMVQVVATSNCRCAFHVFCASPKLAAQADALRTALLGMTDDAMGKEVLADMHLAGWQAVSAEQLDEMRAILAS